MMKLLMLTLAVVICVVNGHGDGDAHQHQHKGTKGDADHHHHHHHHGNETEGHGDERSAFHCQLCTGLKAHITTELIANNDQDTLLNMGIAMCNNASIIQEATNVVHCEEFIKGHGVELINAGSDKKPCKRFCPRPHESIFNCALCQGIAESLGTKEEHPDLPAEYQGMKPKAVVELAQQNICKLKADGGKLEMEENVEPCKEFIMNHGRKVVNRRARACRAFCTKPTPVPAAANATMVP